MAIRKNILLVEDNPDDVELTLRAFRKNNIANTVVVARDGAEALDYLYNTGDWADKEATPLPAFILLDLKLPKVDGLEVLRQIRTRDKTALVPVIILTSSREQQDMVLGYTGGANSYIRKPVDFERFSQAVQQLGMYWLVLNEDPASIGRL